jgi:putative hydrolase of the HAD superfamily
VLGGFRAAATRAAVRLGIPAEQGYAQLRRLFAAGVRGDTFDRWAAMHGWPPSAVPALVEAYRGHEPALRPFPGVPALLDSLRRRARLGLVSDGHLAVQRRKLAALGLAGHFDAIVFSDAWGREAWKPSTRPFEIVTALLAVPGRAAVYVGDNPTKDFLGARRAGLATIWLRRPDGEYAGRTPPTAEHAADMVVGSLAALEALLQSSVGMGA